MWERASGRGHADATMWLAGCFKRGGGVEMNEAKAMELYLKAAGWGSGSAAWNLGDIYYRGQCGVAADKKEALKWYRVAAEHDNSLAWIKVNQLEAELAAASTSE